MPSRRLLAGPVLSLLVLAACMVFLTRSTAAAVTGTATSVNDADISTRGTSFSYSGAWQTGTGFAKYHSDDHYSDSVGATAVLRFRGRVSPSAARLQRITATPVSRSTATPPL